MARPPAGPAELRIAQIAERQYGVFSRTQALKAGATPRTISNRLISERWIALFRGVYRFRGTPQSWEQLVYAACLAAGPGAVASHLTAGALWQLEGIERGPIEVLVPRDRRVRLPGVRVRRTLHLPTSDVTTIGKLPTTKPVRTSINLPAVLGPAHLEVALEDAWRRKLVHPHAIAKRLAEIGGPGWPGIDVLRELVASRIGKKPTGSGKEVRFEQILRAAGEPLPERQYRQVVDGQRFYIDHAYVAEKIAIEIDSGTWHSGLRATTKDRRRQNLLVVKAGWLPLRFMSSELDHAPDQVVSLVRQARLERQPHPER